MNIANKDGDSGQSWKIQKNYLCMGNLARTRKIGLNIWKALSCKHESVDAGSLKRLQTTTRPRRLFQEKRLLQNHGPPKIVMCL